MDAVDRKIKHLEMVQAVIARQSSNSFLVKGWCVTLVAAFFALGTGTGKESYVLLSYLPLLMFWLLDGFYLWQERLFRQLYEEVRHKDAEEVDFSMDTTAMIDKVTPQYRVMFSRTLGLFYISLIVAVLVTWAVTSATGAA